MNPATFFPERGAEATREAREVCSTCPVTAECLDYAMVTRERDGVWGGKSGRQRRQLRSSTAKRDTVCTCHECGTEFMGTYRMLLCSDECRKRRQEAARRRYRLGGNDEADVHT
jgi:hypothetical protein